MKILIGIIAVLLLSASAQAKTFCYKKLDKDGNPRGLTASTCRQPETKRILITKAEFDNIKEILRAKQEEVFATYVAEKKAARDVIIKKLSKKTGISEEELRTLLK